MPFLDRRAPESWQEPSDRWEATHNSAGERSVSEDGELSANSEWRWHHIGHDPAFLDASSNHPNVLTVLEAIMGGPVRCANRNRGYTEPALHFLRVRPLL